MNDMDNNIIIEILIVLGRVCMLAIAALISIATYIIISHVDERTQKRKEMRTENEEKDD